jgi:hypothetical protein
MWRLRRLYSTARFLAAVDCVKAAEPPKGPARAAFCMRTMQTFWAPPAVPWQVMPWGIWTCACVSCVVEIIADAAYLDGEVHNRGGRKTTDTDSGNVLGDGGLLEGSGVGSAGGGIDGSGQRASTVLVDLVEGHGDGAIISSGGETLGSTRASSGGDTSLSSTLGSLGSSGSTTGRALSAASTAGKGIEKTTLGGSSATSGGATGTHEGSDSRSSIDGTATLGAAKSGGLAAHLLGTDDGGISLRAGKRVARVTRSTVDD